MPSAFDPVSFAARQQAKQDYMTRKQEQPAPISVPQMLTRLQLLEKLLGL